MIYLLDSNLCIQYLRGKNLLVRQRSSAKTVREICLCSVVKAELYLGTWRSSNPAGNRAKVNAMVPFRSMTPQPMFKLEFGITWKYSACPSALTIFKLQLSPWCTDALW